ncbi:MAG: hypothetical protein JAZ15_18925 [Candidatus Thiodiazotropha endolucinida]|nr:hypothetical protein [Candidatus Thiodiazotropha taylori]MCW4315095.1 hypothetical protein [Candidatus Thiodiazotropha taylori]
MESIFKVALLVFALVVLPATWYYAKRNGKLPKKNKAFISNLKEAQRKDLRMELITTIAVLVVLSVIILLVEFGVL